MFFMCFFPAPHPKTKSLLSFSALGTAGEGPRGAGRDAPGDGGGTAEAPRQRLRGGELFAAAKLSAGPGALWYVHVSRLIPNWVKKEKDNCMWKVVVGWLIYVLMFWERYAMNLLYTCETPQKKWYATCQRLNAAQRNSQAMLVNQHEPVAELAQIVRHNPCLLRLAWIQWEWPSPSGIIAQVQCGRAS